MAAALALTPSEADALGQELDRIRAEVLAERGAEDAHYIGTLISHQIEHHLFPDLPSNRYAQIAPRVRKLCEKYGIPYTTGPLPCQHASTWARIWCMALP